jgi:CRP/FNR family nitrogen fixation transcriptional regulator
MRAKASSIPTNDIRSFPFDQTEQYHRSANRLGRLAPLGVMTSCHRDQEICGQGRPATCWYCVVSGVARGYVARADGHRQIVDLLLPGDFCGFTAGDEYDCTVDAIVEGTVVAGYPRRRVEMLADQDPQLAREIREVTLGAMSRLQAQLLIVGRVTAVEKVGSFLLEMAARMSEGPPGLVLLPISRYDIADYLALSVETVSRSLTDLKHRGVIVLSGTRCVKIVDQDALRSERDRSLACAHHRWAH